MKKNKKKTKKKQRVQYRVLELVFMQNRRCCNGDMNSKWTRKKQNEENAAFNDSDGMY